MRIPTLTLALFTLVACGVTANTPVTALEEADWRKECKSLNQPEKTVTCEVDGFEFEMTVGGDAEECDADDFDTPEFTDACEATVGEFRACMQAFYDDPCAMDTPAECDTLMPCFQG